jgi:hypothetical protein
MADVFISHSEADRDLVARIAALLEAQGWSAWWIQSFEPLKRWQWKDVIEREIAAARCVVAVWTPQSLDSEWVRDEAAHGLRRGILVPLIAGVELPSAFRQSLTVDLSTWDGASRTAEVERLLNGVRHALDGAKMGGVAKAARLGAAPASGSSPRTPKPALRRAAPGLAWAAVTALVGVFTRDYWWPAIRPWLGL